MIALALTALAAFVLGVVVGFVFGVVVAVTTEQGEM